MEPRKKLMMSFLTGLWVLFSLLLALCASCLLCVLIVVFSSWEGGRAREK
jgi:hypothetical protein